MKRIIIIALLAIPFLGYGQLKKVQRGALNNSRAEHAINAGIDQTNTNTAGIATNASAIAGIDEFDTTNIVNRLDTDSARIDANELAISGLSFDTTNIVARLDTDSARIDVNEDSIANYDTRITAATSSGVDQVARDSAVANAEDIAANTTAIEDTAVYTDYTVALSDSGKYTTNGYATMWDLKVAVDSLYELITYGVVLNTDYKALLAVWAVDPLGDTLKWQNQMMDSLDYYDILDSAAVIYVIANNNEDNAKVNWVNPGTHDITDPGSTSPTFTRYSDYLGDGSSDYLSTNYNPTDDGGAIQNSMSLSAYTLEADAAASVVIVGSDGVSDAMIYPYAATGSGQFGAKLNDNSYRATDVSNAQGLSTVVRREAANVELYRGSTASGNIANTSISLAERDLFILAKNDAGSPAQYSSNKVSFIFIGSALSDEQVTALNTIVETYMDNIGIGVQ